MKSRCKCWLVSLAAVMAVVAMSACGDSSGDDDDDDITDPCATKTLCGLAGVSCDGDVLVTCAADADGCLVETTDDCGADGWVCDETEGACIDPGTSCDDAACADASDGDSFCSGDTAVSCAADGDGCLIATTVDCAADSKTCDDSGASAVCVETVTCDDAACVGASEGDLSCAGYALRECTDTDDDGCLELVVSDCTPALCDDSATPVCGTLTETGESCADAIPVLASGFFISGADFTADFADDVVLTDSSCVTRPAGSVDAVFSVPLMTGDTVAIAEFGGFDSTRNIQTTCGAAEVCAASDDDPDKEVLTYTAETDETIYVIVEAYSSSPSTTDYAVAISLNPTCGNGLFEAGEGCDDGNAAADDGCSATCEPEFGYECDLSSPSVCALYPFLGTFAAGVDIPDVVSTDLLPRYGSDFYRIEFSESVLLSGTASAASTGDPDFYLIDSTGTDVVAEGNYGDETWSDAIVPPGMYVIELYAWGSDMETGYTITLATTAGPVCGNGTVELGEVCDDGDTDPADGCGATCAVEFGYDCDGASPTVCTMYTSLGSFAAAETIPNTVVTDSVPAGDSHYYLIEFTEDVLLSGTLVAGSTGDLDLYVYDADGEVFRSTASGGEAFTNRLLAAGTYLIRIHVWGSTTPADTGYTLSLSTVAAPVCGNGALEFGEVCDDGDTDPDDGCDATCEVEFGWSCDEASPSVCTAYPSLGSFAAGETIADTVVSESVPAGDSHYYVIEFTDAVLLSGSLTAGSTGDLDLYVYDADGEVFRENSGGDESWTDQSLAAGRYLLRVYVYGSTTPADTGYTLSLSTTTP